MSKKKFFNEISNLTRILIEIGISSEQNFPSEMDNSIYITGNFDHGIILRNIDYRDIYSVLNNQRNFNFKFLDGALVQLMYSFDHNDKLLKHRLCYFPSPTLLAYDEYFESYENDILYADMVMKNILPIPVRFDYEQDEKKFKEISHPYSHLTLGQHKNCRIPLAKPLTPYFFISFIIRNFYSTIYPSFLEKHDQVPRNDLEICITPNEQKILHMNM